MLAFFKDIIQTLLYGGLTPEEYKRIAKSVTSDNRKTLLKMSCVSVAAFFLAIILYPPPVQPAPLIAYVSSIIFLFILIIMVKIFKENKFIIGFGIYLFIFVLYSAGIYISAIAGIANLASTFMVFLIVIPLLFMIRPVIIDLIVVVVDIAFVVVLCVMKQDPVLFASNKLNAIIYGLLSIVIGTLMMRIKLERMNRLWEVRYLSETDQLTGLPNRWSYERNLQKIVNNEIGGDYVIAAFDINGLKITNDNFGHAVGDELIKGASECLKNCFGSYGKIFRTGGDEFVAILFAENIELEKLMSELAKTTAEWKSENINSISISSGYAARKDFPNESVYELVKIADELMYKAKSEHYRKSGNDRRGKRC